MWDMSKHHDILALQLSEHVRIIQKKKCFGYKGHWECEDEYPDHIVPVSKFNKDKYGAQGVQPRCKKCHRHSVSLDKHPTTGELKRNWKTDHAKSLGGVRNTPEWQSYLDGAEVQWNIEIKNHLLDTAPAEEVITHMESTKSEFGQSKPMTKRTITKVEGERVPEGWVYLVRNPDVPSIVKIGKTYTDGIGDIMSSARRFGRSELIHKCWFGEAYRAEQSIHKVLIKYNLRVLGYTDCGKELFECSIDIAMSAIRAERGDTEDAA